jgi:hypothetical protein
MAGRIGVVTGVNATGSATRVRFEGARSATTIHNTYLELSDPSLIAPES